MLLIFSQNSASPAQLSWLSCAPPLGSNPIRRLQPNGGYRGAVEYRPLPGADRASREFQLWTGGSIGVANAISRTFSELARFGTKLLRWRDQQDKEHF
jgi:hypothetical protein